MAIIKFSEEETKVKLDYDSGKETDNKFEEGKKQYMWSCNDGDVFYATPSLNTLLTSVGAKRGKVLSIRKKRLEGKDIPVFEVDVETLDSLGKRILDSNLNVVNTSSDNSDLIDRMNQLEGKFERMVTKFNDKFNEVYGENGAEVKEQPFSEDDLPF